MKIIRRPCSVHITQYFIYAYVYQGGVYWLGNTPAAQGKSTPKYGALAAQSSQRLRATCGVKVFLIPLLNI